MTNVISANALRKMVPPQDLNDRAFKIDRDFGLRPHGLAYTLEMLHSMCREYGEVAVLDAKWDAMFTWLSKEPGVSLCASIDVVREALALWRENALFEAGLSRKPGVHLPVIQRISTGSQEEAETIALDTLARWEAAGRPFLTGQRIRSTHQLMQYRIRMATAGNA